MTRRFQFSLHSQVGWFGAFALGLIPGIAMSLVANAMDPARRPNSWWFLAASWGLTTAGAMLLVKRWSDP